MIFSAGVNKMMEAKGMPNILLENKFWTIEEAGDPFGIYNICEWKHVDLFNLWIAEAEHYIDGEWRYIAKKKIYIV